MKRIISLILTLTMLLSIAPVVLAAEFTDFNSTHWAYEYVTALVNDGTINGYADGTFRPEGTVTRAEFVKMIGNGPETRTSAFDDVSSSHWAYNYIMTSGLEALKDNMFMPDTPITRGDVANLLWKRAGSPMGVTAPPVVHRQSSNWDAVSWVYTNGIMVGDDYVDLRLGDTLTRGEASALIVRSRSVNADTPKTNFITSVNPQIFETVYNAYRLVDRPYDENATITNGELAMTAARLQCGEDQPTYSNVSAQITFEHKFAQPINMLCRYYLGMENDNASYADKNATVEEAIAALMFATSKSAKAYVPYGTDTTYPQITTLRNDEFSKLVNTAFYNGIWFTTAEELNPNKEISMKELACLVLEFNGFSGFHNISVFNGEKTIYRKGKIRASFDSYPENYSDYRIILESVDNIIYETPFKNSVSAPSNTYELTNSFASLVTSMISTWVSLLSQSGYKLEVSFYPGIAVDNGNGYTLRCGVKFVDIPVNTKLGDLINCVNAADGEKIVNSGDTTFVDIDTGKKIHGVTMDINDMVLSQIIK